MEANNNENILFSERRTRSHISAYRKKTNRKQSNRELEKDLPQQIAWSYHLRRQFKKDTEIQLLEFKLLPELQTLSMLNQ